MFSHMSGVTLKFTSKVNVFGLLLQGLSGARISYTRYWVRRQIKSVRFHWQIWTVQFRMPKCGILRTRLQNWSHYSDCFPLVNRISTKFNKKTLRTKDRSCTFLEPKGKVRQYRLMILRRKSTQFWSSEILLWRKLRKLLKWWVFWLSFQWLTTGSWTQPSSWWNHSSTHSIRVISYSGAAIISWTNLAIY